MKNPFATKGFDSIIGRGVRITGNLEVPIGHTMVLDGEFAGESILGTVVSVKDIRPTLVVGGVVNAKRVTVDNVTVSGVVACDILRVDGCLRLEKGAQVNADVIEYFDLIIDPTAVIQGRMVKITRDLT
jgi:cytoskeletal protein CcmA (bactofilin family)